MRINYIYIENFRAINKLELQNLPDAIVIAGPNGCGKSSLFDAIRLLKLAYGQYHQNEYQSWFNEFQINVQRIRQEARHVLHDPNKPMLIRAEFELNKNETEYLTNNARELYSQLNWAQFRGMRSMDGGYFVVNPATQRAQGPIVESQTSELMKALEKVISNKTHIAELRMYPGNDPVATPSPVIELIFSVYKPRSLGIIDYHGPNRNYGREQVGGINLIDNQSNKQGQNTLYNTQNKYTGIKTEMAQSYIRQLLSREAGEKSEVKFDLKETLDELFKVFFPGKNFLEAIQGSFSRIKKTMDSTLTNDNLATKEKQIRTRLKIALKNGRWMREFRGRNILKLFCGKHQEQLGIPYEKLRNIIINRMREEGFKPIGMQNVIKSILSS